MRKRLLLRVSLRPPLNQRGRPPGLLLQLYDR